jgi:hypothetical protein
MAYQHQGKKIIKLCGQLEEQYFDYLVFNIVNCSINSGLVHSGARRLAHSRKLSATLGGSTSTHPGVRKITLKTCDFINISNATIPTALGGLTTTSPPIVVVIIRHRLDYGIVDYGRAVHAALDKS